MEWSVDSEMLALVVVQPPGSCGGGGDVSAKPQHCVQVWQRSNWHWYLKHEARHEAGQVSYWRCIRH